MADTKLSALTELAATPANNDEVYIRDVSEAAADESKRITIANLLAGGATIATGSYTGNDADDRQITVGFKCSMVIVSGFTSHFWIVYGASGTIHQINDTTTLNKTDVLLHGTDGFVVDRINANFVDNTHYYFAISE